MDYSIIIPTFGRPDEVATILKSLSELNYDKYEVLIVDGSPDKVLHPVIDEFKNKLNLVYLHKPLLGISDSRNLGSKSARGEYLIFFDSDCIIPTDYLNKVSSFLEKNKVDGFGGPDAAHESFSPVLKAINYAMTSFLTTGGIRGKKKHVGKFQLRGFNMGIKAAIFEKVNGYSGLHVSEDIDLSIRLHKAGYITELIPDAYVYHKRKSNFYKFYKQMFLYGKGRIDLQVRHGDALKLVHMFPSFFVLYLIFGTTLSFFSPILFLLFISSFGLYFTLVFITSTIINKSLYVGILSIFSSFICLTAYGLGMIKNIFTRLILKKGSDSLRYDILKE